MREDRFYLFTYPGSNRQILAIMDYVWWHKNSTEVENWMDDNLLNGRKTQVGFSLMFKTDCELSAFLLKWG